MRQIIAAGLLATGLGFGMAAPAMAQSTEWSGSNLSVTRPSSCRVAVERAYLRGSGWSATINLVFRNRGSATVNVTADVRLQGNGQSKSGTYGPYRIVPAAASDQATLPPYGGSLAGSRLAVNITACAPA